MKTKNALITAVTAVLAFSAYSCGKVEDSEKKVDIDISRSDSTSESFSQPLTEISSESNGGDEKSTAKNNLRAKGIGIEFRGEMDGDTTGKIRLALTATSVDAVEYAVDYYTAYFNSDDEIHAIVNKKQMTTACITRSGDSLNVKIHQYTDGEEEDTLKLFSGNVLKEEVIGLDGSLISSKENQSTSTAPVQTATQQATTANSSNSSNSNTGNNNSGNSSANTPVATQPEETPTEAPTEAPAEIPTEAQTETPAEIPTEPPTEAPTVAEQPDYTFSLNDLNTNPADMFGKIGQGQTETAPACLSNGADSVIHSYDGLRIECYSLNGTETVYGITITSDKWDVLGNVKVGSTRSEIESVYSEGTEENGKYVCKMGESTLTFAFAGDTVSSVDFYMPVN